MGSFGYEHERSQLSEISSLRGQVESLELELNKAMVALAQKDNLIFDLQFDGDRLREWAREAVKAIERSASSIGSPAVAILLATYPTDGDDNA